MISSDNVPLIRSNDTTINAAILTTRLSKQTPKPPDQYLCFCCCNTASIYNNCNVVTCGQLINVPRWYCCSDITVRSCAQKHLERRWGRWGEIFPILWSLENTYNAFTTAYIPGMVTDIKLFLPTTGGVSKWCYHYRCSEQSSDVPTASIWY